jgi:hypothetical protein
MRTAARNAVERHNANSLAYWKKIVGETFGSNASEYSSSPSDKSKFRGPKYRYTHTTAANTLHGGPGA